MQSSLIAFLFLVLISLGCSQTSKFETSNTATANTITARNSSPENVKPIFNAADLAGKNESQVKKILGNQIEAWTTSDGSGRRMHEYQLGEQTLVEFDKNRIKSLVIFFEGGDVDQATAYQRVGLRADRQKPPGIDSITTNQNWIKIFYK